MADLELKYADLSYRDSPARKANREALREHIEEIQAEHATSRFPPRRRAGLQLADWYTGGHRQGSLWR